MSLADTPRSERLHITLFGRRNSGKSSLINALTGQKTALVSDTPGTTTDLVYKSMELHGIGPCLFIDTPGFDDEGKLGRMRIEQTLKAVDKTDFALLLCSSCDLSEELRWMQLLESKDIPFVLVLSKADLQENPQTLVQQIQLQCRKTPYIVSTVNRQGIEELRRGIIENLSGKTGQLSISGNLVGEDDVVLLVMPQDLQAPKGRLILPQVQTIRELLDKKCIVISCTIDKLGTALTTFAHHPPKLIITDSQVFKTVYEQKPAESKLTSFSVLFAQYKGDIRYYTESVNILSRLNESSRILIAEACTHAPLSEDIGRVKLPKLLRRHLGDNLQIDIVSGADFPKDLRPYSLVIQCGACMFNRKHVLSRIEEAKKQGIPMTNYGVAIAYLNGILDFIDY